jgi:hypothetical protein
MIGNDKWILTGAWAVMAAVGAFSLYRIAQIPEIDPTISRLAEELRRAQNTDIIVCGGPDAGRPKFPICTWPDRVGYFTPTEESSRFHTQRVGHPLLPKDRDILVLPFPKMGSAKADLDGATITWSTEKREVEHQPWMHPKPATPNGFTVWREETLGQSKAIAQLGPDARSYTDYSTEPRKTYTYWVTLTGVETDRSNNKGDLVTVTNRAERPVAASCPAAGVKIRLVLGDEKRAMLRVETYDRARKAWYSKNVMTIPGEKVAGTGWSLNKLRFEEFTLVAELTDDDGVARVLSTRD